MRNICLIEDSEDLQQIIKLKLKEWYTVSCAGTLADGEALIAKEVFDLILLDVNLPDGSGFKLCASLKADPRTRDIPIIFLTGKTDPIDKMMGFWLGADDYIVKPFEPIEVRARIEARLRNLQHRSEKSDSFTFGKLRFDRVKVKVTSLTAAGETDLNLTPFEFKILAFLASRPGELFDKAALLRHIADPGVHVSDQNIYTHISALRKKLGENSTYLESVPRLGYRLNPPTV